MRLTKTAVATVAILAVSGSAFAAGTRDSLTVTMNGTARVQAGGKLTLTLVRRTATARNFHVTVHYDVTVSSKTVLGFAAHPCKSTSCVNQSVQQISLSRGGHHVKFTGHVPVKRRDDGTACVYLQVRDKGPKGKAAGRIVHNGSLKGVGFCRSVK
jgi:hypothetical protein